MTRRATAEAWLAAPVTAADHSRGPEDAPVTLVEYGDYECPACGDVYPVIRELLARLGDNVRFVFRYFPLTMVHPNAELAAEAAEAAAQQGQFWPMHDLLYENQEVLDGPNFVHFADVLGLDSNRVATELVRHAHTGHVRHEFLDGIRSGVNSTPTFFVNGARHDGGLDLEALLEAVESARRDG